MFVPLFKSETPVPGAKPNKAHAPAAVSIGDLNGDGYLDIAAANSTTGNVSILLGSSSGNFAVGTTLTVGTTPTGIIMSDIDRDGDLDILTANSGSANISVQLNSGVANFSAGTTITVGTKPEDLEAGDFNADGLIDLAVINEDSRSISILIGSGAAAFTAGNTLTTGGSGAFGGFDLGIGDINNDGVSDIVNVDTGNTAATDGNQISIFVQNKIATSGEADVNVSTQANAQTLMKIVDTAISRITSERSGLAAIHGRLESVVAANLLLVENYSSALSSVEDSDIALETSELVKNQILQQAQVAVLAQANTQMQVVLGLLRN